MTPEFVSALQEFIRTVFIGLVWAIIAVIVIIEAGINRELGTFHIQWNVANAVFAVEMLTTIKVALGSALDKFLHKSNIKTPLDIKVLDQLK